MNRIKRSMMDMCDVGRLRFSFFLLRFDLMLENFTIGIGFELPTGSIE